MTANPQSLGMRIRRARERARLSQEDLARAVGASVRAVGDWENDRRKPRNRLGAIEEVLGVSFADEAPQPPSPPPELAGHPELVDEIRRFAPDPGDQARVMAAIAATVRGEPQPPTGPGGAAQSDGARGEAGREAG